MKKKISPSKNENVATRESTVWSGQTAIGRVTRPSDGLLQRAQLNSEQLTPDEVRTLQHTIGNQAVQRILARRAPTPLATPTPVTGATSPPIVQPKLMVGPVGDKYEQEADRIARSVANRIPARANAKSPINPTKHIQRTMPSAPGGLGTMGAVGREGGMVDADFAQGIRSARSGGQPLDDSTRESMQESFGADFSGVRVHVDSTADKLSRSVQAKAFTTGNDIFFRKGAYQPDKRQGKELLAHELTHTLQQGAATTNTIQRDDDEDESVLKTLLSSGGEFAGLAGDIGGIFTAQGMSNASDSSDGVTRDDFWGRGNRGPLHDLLGEDRFSNTEGLGASDFVGGLGNMTTSTLGMVDAFGKLKDKEAGKLDKTKAGFDLLGGVTGLIAGGARSAGGIMDMSGYGATDSVTGKAVHSSNFGFSTPQSGDPKYIGDWAGGATGVLGTAAKTVGGVKQFKGWVNSLKKGGKLRERGGWSIARSVGRGGRTGTDILGTAASGAKSIATLVGQAQNSGLLDMASSAGKAATTLGYVAGGAGTALGAMQMLSGGYKIFKGGRRRSKLTERIKNANRNQLSGQREIDIYNGLLQDPNIAGDQQLGPLVTDLLNDSQQQVTSSKNNSLAFEHLKEIQKKKQVRGGIDLALGAMGTLGGALTLSGFGAIPGLVLGGTAGAFKLGQFGLRKFKQAMRDRTANKLTKLGIDPDKATKDDRKQLPWYLRAVDYDVSKTTAKKEARNQETINTILGMGVNTQDRNVALETLGTSETQLGKGLDQASLAKERQKRMDKLAKQESKDQKKKKGAKGAGFFTNERAKIASDQDLLKLIQEERLLKAIKKR